MSDNPLRDSLEESIVETQQDEIAEPEKEKTQEEPVADQPEVKNETQEQEKAVESFAEKGELVGRTPEELEEIYQKWQSSYTKKRQEETSYIKELEKKLKDLETSFQQTQNVESQQLDTQRLANEAKQQFDLGRMTVEQYTEYMRQLMAEEAREIARQELTKSEMEAKKREEQSNQEQLMSDFVSIDPRFDENSPSYDERLSKLVKNELADALDDYMAENQTSIGFNARELAKQALKAEEERIDNIIKERTIQSTKAAKKKSEELKKSGAVGSNVDSNTTKGLSIRDHIAAAMDE